jgi:hypothetical protein
VQETLDKKKSNNQKLRETLESEQQALRKKEEETREIKEGLNIMYEHFFSCSYFLTME